MLERWSKSRSGRRGPAARAHRRPSQRVMGGAAFAFAGAACQMMVDVDDYSFQAQPLQPASDDAPPARDAGEGDGAEGSPACGADGAIAAICGGNWRYHQWASCAVSEAGPVTPEQCASAPVCALWLTCSDWSFGAGEAATQVSVFQHQVATCRDRNCFNACTEQADNIQATLSELTASVPAEYQSQVSIVEQVDQLVSSRRYSPGFLEDDKFDEIRTCTVAFEYPTPASGQAAVCGCETFECRSAGCGTDPTELTSPPGVAFDVVRALDPYVADSPAPTCSSCDAPGASGVSDPS